MCRRVAEGEDVPRARLQDFPDFYDVEGLVNRKFLPTVRNVFKVACTSAPIFEKKYVAVPPIFCTNIVLSDWSNA